jgi:hypothetical protein
VTADFRRRLKAAPGAEESLLFREKIVREFVGKLKVSGVRAGTRPAACGGVGGPERPEEKLKGYLRSQMWNPRVNRLDLLTRGYVWDGIPALTREIHASGRVLCQS